ncbi:hypothetical protein N2152v2_010119 [Parachlorella kessleri]
MVSIMHKLSSTVAHNSTTAAAPPPASTEGTTSTDTGCEGQLRPVAAFLEEQIARRSLRPDESQQAAARLLDGLFLSFLQHARPGREEARYPAQQEQPAGQAPEASREEGLLSSSAGASVSAASAAAVEGPLESQSVQGSCDTSKPSENIRPMPQQQGHRGAYLWGEVGSGKTLLMDAFYRAAAAATLAMPGAPQQHETPGQDMHRIPVTAPQVPAMPREERQVASGSIVATGAAAPGEGGTSSAASQGVRSGSGSGRLPAVARRTHFHAFMLDVHKRLHDLHQRVPRVASKSRQGLPVYRYAPILEDPVRLVGHQIAQEANLLCLDELHVTDVADALILNKLFEAILGRGTWVVFTSNRPPEDLYKGGLSRKYFEPFIHLIERNLQVARVGSGVDYRQHTEQQQQQQQQQSQQLDAQVWGQPLPQQPFKQQQAEGATPQTEGQGSTAGSPATWQGQRFVGAAEAGLKLRAAWLSWQQQHHAQTLQEHRLSVGFGRELGLPEAAWAQGKLAAYLTFDQLCGRHGIVDQERRFGAALGPADFVSLASKVDVLFLEGVPALGPAQRDEARRFLTLVDALYDRGAKLCCSMAVPPRDLFLPLLAAAKAQGVDPNLGASRAAALEVPTVAAPQHEDREPEDRTTRARLEEEVIAYRRAMSRLDEMTRGAGGDAGGS